MSSDLRTKKAATKGFESNKPRSDNACLIHNSEGHTTAMCNIYLRKTNTGE